MVRLRIALDRIKFSREYSLRMLEQVSPADWFRMPAPAVTHIGWQVGHLAIAEYRLILERVRGPRPEDDNLISAEFLKLFGKDSVPDPDASKYPSPSDIRGVLDRVHAQAMRKLSELPEAELEAPPVKSHPLANTKLECLFWCAHHEMLHAGQIGLVPAAARERADLVTMIPSDRDARLAWLLAGLVEEARAGRAADVEVLARENPDLAVELRELWAVAGMADELASDGAVDSAAPTFVTGAEAATDRRTAEGPPAGPVGDYELMGKIGEGGMGVVYKARQKGLGRVVALKMIQRGALASAADVARFRAEAAAAAHLEHPQIVPVYEVGEQEGQPYFSMKYIAGSTLAKKLADGPLSPRETAALLLPVCRAIAHAHQRGVIHRDLKPSNILIDAEGQPLVGDFGLAKRIDMGSADAAPQECESLTRTGAILGSPSYMSPEQAAGSRGVVGPASDVYSLGAILYQCLTGRPPFQAASAVDVVMMVLEQDPVLPRLLNPRADADLEMIALKCLQKPAELRYKSAAALADDLAAYLANEPISARSTNVTQLVSRILRETHHAGILENWGILWMLHSLVLLVLCLITNWLQWRGVESRLPYVGLWVIGLGAWAGVFWSLRRRAGPITFIERQIAHVWGASMIASGLLFVVETLLDMPVLKLSPVLPLIGAMVFVIKAGILSGAFYFQAAANFAVAIVMAWIRHSGLPDIGLSLYGIVAAASFFVPGLKYYRQRRAK